MEKAIREGYTGRGCGCGCGGVCVSAMEHIQFCTYFFFLRAGPGGGGGIQTHTTLQIRGGDGGLRETRFQTRRETRKISGAGGGGSPSGPAFFSAGRGSRDPPLAAGCSAPAQAPRCCRRPRRGAGERQGSSRSFLADDVIFISLVVFH